MEASPTSELLGKDSTDQSNAAPEEESKPSEFKGNQTEDVMLRYIESPDATFPKTFMLNRGRFKGETTFVPDASIAQLAKIAEVMAQYPDMKIEIYTHVSSGGSAEMSPEKKERLQLKWQEIGRKRARNIKKLLHEKGIPNRKITAKIRFQRREPTEEYWGAEIVITHI